MEPRVLQGLSGEMNSVVLVFEYPGLGAYEQEEGRAFGDEEYVHLAMAMPFYGPLHYAIFRRFSADVATEPSAASEGSQSRR